MGLSVIDVVSIFRSLFIGVAVVAGTGGGQGAEIVTGPGAGRGLDVSKMTCCWASRSLVTMH